MQKVIVKSLGDFGSQLAMRPNGRKVQEALDAELRRLPAGGVLALDFEGVEMMDYSFADEAIGALYSRMSAHEYPDKHLVLLSRSGEHGEALLENVEVALNRRDVAALVLPGDDRAAVNKLLALSPEKEARGPSRSSSRKKLPWRVVGTLPGHLVDTLGEVMDKGTITVRELANALGLDSATACNNRIARLYQLHLVRREATVVPEGGRQYCYSSVI